MSKMYFYTVTASFLLIFAVQGLTAGTHGPCTDEDDDIISPEPEDVALFSPECLKQVHDTKKYPYLAIVYFECEKGTGSTLGAIVSERRVLMSTPPFTIMENTGKCTYEVLAGADQHAKGGTKYEAKPVRIGEEEELTLFKLKTPIKFGPRAKSIPLVSEKPGVGSQALFISWIHHFGANKTEGIFERNVTLIDKKECRKVIPWNPQSVDRFNGNVSSFCIRNFEIPCLYSSSSMLIANEKLAGLNIDADGTVETINYDDYFYDIAHYSSSIKCLM